MVAMIVLNLSSVGQLPSSNFLIPLLKRFYEYYVFPSFAYLFPSSHLFHKLLFLQGHKLCILLAQIVIGFCDLFQGVLRHYWMVWKLYWYFYSQNTPNTFSGLSLCTIVRYLPFLSGHIYWKKKTLNSPSRKQLSTSHLIRKCFPLHNRESEAGIPKLKVTCSDNQLSSLPRPFKNLTCSTMLENRSAIYKVQTTFAFTRVHEP